MLQIDERMLEIRRKLVRDIHVCGDDFDALAGDILDNEYRMRGSAKFQLKI